MKKMDLDFTAEIPEMETLKVINPANDRDQLKYTFNAQNYSKKELRSKLLLFGITLIGTYAIASILLNAGVKKKKKSNQEQTGLPAISEPKKENHLLSIFKSILISLALAYTKNLLVRYIDSLNDSESDEKN